MPRLLVAALVCSVGALRVPSSLRASAPASAPRRAAPFAHPAAVSAAAALASLPLGAHAADVEGILGGLRDLLTPDVTLGGLLTSDDLHTLLLSFGMTVISWGVPVSAIGLAAITLGSFAGGNGGGDDFDSNDLPPFLAKLAGVSREPKEYLKIERLNAKLDSYDYSLAKATVSRDSAMRDNSRREFGRRFGAELAALELSAGQREAVERAATAYRKSSRAIGRKKDRKLRMLRSLAFAPNGVPSANGARAPEAATDSAKVDAPEVVKDADDAEEEEEEGKKGPGAMLGGMMGGMGGMLKTSKLQADVASLGQEQLEAEMEFLRAIARVVPPKKVEAIGALFSGGGPPRPGAPASGSGPAGVVPAGADALEVLRDLSPHQAPRRVFKLGFAGDVQASQVEQLRQEVTAVLRAAKPSDEVVLVLNTGGGTVTGYGLAAAQLVRIKEAGLKLTICVEQVAASGGYMMACVADHIAASPFAVIGSIGVVTEIPNVYERLKKEGVVFSTITAGKYKRTLTPTKQIEAEDIAKQKEDIEQILKLFKGFVGRNRPSLDIDHVATGEIWFGPDALEQSLVDELATPDEVLLRHARDGAEVLSLRYVEPPKPLAERVGGSGGVRAGVRDALLELGARALGLPRGASTLDYDPSPGSEVLARPPRGAEPMLMRPRGGAEPMLMWPGPSQPGSGDGGGL